MPGLRNQARSSRFIKTYGMAFRHYRKMFRSQGNACAICKKKVDDSFFSDEKKSLELHVDHDHVTGDVRGLLCMKCNTGLGFFKDNPEILQNAIEYLLNPPAKVNPVKIPEKLAARRRLGIALTAITTTGASERKKKSASNKSGTAALPSKAGATATYLDRTDSSTPSCSASENGDTEARSWLDVKQEPSTRDHLAPWE